MNKTAHFFLPILVALFSITAFTQNTPGKTYFDKMPNHFIVFKEPKKDTGPSLPFDTIIVQDARPNTSFLGFVNMHHEILKITFEESLNKSLENYIQKNYKLEQKTDSSHTLFILIKKLILTDFIPAGDNLDPSQISWNAGIVLEAEFFSGIGSLYKTLYRIDTLFAIEDRLRNNEADILQASIKVCLDRLVNKHAIDLKKGKKNFTLDEILNYAGNLYNYPIIKDSVLNKGVYLSFEEFRNNIPSITEYEIKKDIKTDVIYIDENGEKVLLRNCWGYCDGKSSYIKTGENFFALYRSENSFCFKGFKELKKHQYLKPGQLIMFGLATTLISKHGKQVYYKGDVTALQLDMKTGEVF